MNTGSKNINPILAKFIFYCGYVITMLVLIGAIFLIWEINVLPAIKFVLLLPLIFVGTLLTLSVADGYHH